jgi:hypothetical protein
MKERKSGPVLCLWNINGVSAAFQHTGDKPNEKLGKTEKFRDP